MITIHFDGGLRKNLIAITDEHTNQTIIIKRPYNNMDYEWDALELALDYIDGLSTTDKLIVLVGDNNQVIRWINEPFQVCGDSIIKQKCLDKMNRLKRNHKQIIGKWVKRNENLAGRILECHTRRSNKAKAFVAKWYECPKCVFKSLIEKEKSEHFYNNHITNG